VPRELRELRELVRHLVGLTCLRTALKNRVHGLLGRQGVQDGRAELFGPRGRRLLGELSLPESTRRAQRPGEVTGQRERDADPSLPLFWCGYGLIYGDGLG
jgi:transposase